MTGTGGPLAGTTAIVTGASAGIGAAAARGLAGLGAEVAVVGRSPEKTKAVAESIGARAHTADFAHLDEVRALAGELLDAYPRIDLLANNAGAVFAHRRASADGHELTFQVNHLAPFLLTALLLDRIAASPDGRVITTGSAAYRSGRLDLDDLDGNRRRYSPMGFYAASKLAELLFTRELARRTPVCAAAFHPGAVATEVGRDNALTRRLLRTRAARLVMRSAEEGAEPLLTLATEPDPEAIDGAYFHRFRREEPRHRRVRDAAFAASLWDRSAALTGVAVPPVE